MHNTIEFTSYIDYKKAELGIEFHAGIEYLCDESKNYWVPLDSEIIIRNDYSKNELQLIFMSDIVEHYLGQAQIFVGKLKKVKFHDGVLSFVMPKNKKIKLK